MSFSDEPNVIPERKRSKGRFLWIGGLLVFIGLLLSVAFFPRIIDYRRAHTETGPHGGSYYEISFGGHPYGLEIARSEEFDFRPTILIEPLEEGHTWEPEAHEVHLQVAEEDFEVLTWDSVEGYFGLSEHRIHPQADVRMEIRLMRGDQVVWRGSRWSFRSGAGGHGHAH